MVHYFAERLETPVICIIFMIRVLTKKTNIFIHVEGSYFKAVNSNSFSRRYLRPTKPVLRSSQLFCPFDLFRLEAQP